MPSKLSKYQGFTIERVHRSKLNPAPYNPRYIDRSSRAGLRKSIDLDGLVETLVWNRRTGNLVSGHQRLSIIDEKEGGTDYELDVAVLDVDEVRERQLNVRLNSLTIQGGFDQAALEELIASTEGIDLHALGFSQAELDQLLPEQSSAADLVLPDAGLQEDMDRLAATRPEKPKLSEEELEKLKEQKRQSKEKARSGDRAAYITFVFGDTDELDRFCRAAGLGEDAVQDGRRLAEKMNIDLEKLP